MVTSINAQNKPALESFVGYSYSKLLPDSYAYKINVNGGHANLTFNTKIIDLSADFSGHAGTSLGLDARVFNLMIGPRFSRHGKKIGWFVHSLYGISKINSDIRLGGVAGSNIPSSVFVAYSKSETSFAFIPAGGGLDIQINNRAAIRAFQFDLIFTQWGNSGSQKHPRLSTGLIIRWGKK